MFKHIKYPITLLFLGLITVYTLLSLNNVVKPLNDDVGFGLFIISSCIVYAEKAQYE